MNNSQSGNIFAFLFGAVALVGVLTAASMQLVTGPLKTMTAITQKNLVESQLLTNARLVIIHAGIQANNGDADSDSFIEPVEYVPNGTGDCNIALVGGGCLPITLGASLTDPFGSMYGYCVWDHGAVDNGHADGAPAAPYRLNGDTDPTRPVITLISAGRDRTFQTSCLAYDGVGSEGVSRVVGSDDLVFTYTYAEATAASGGLWTIKPTDADTAEIAKDLEVKDSANNVTVAIDRATGIGDFLGITTDLITAKTGSIISIDGALLMEGSAFTNGARADFLNTANGNITKSHIGMRSYASGNRGVSIGEEGNDDILHVQTNTGNVGIGTTSPASRLTVQGPDNADSIQLNHQAGGKVFGLQYFNSGIPTGLPPASSNFGVKMESVGNGHLVVDLRANDANDGLYVRIPSVLETPPAPSDRVALSVRGNGRVGLGTATPGSALHIQNSGASYLRLEDSAGVLGGDVTSAVAFYAGAQEHGVIGFPGTNFGNMYLRNRAGNMIIEADQQNVHTDSRIHFNVDGTAQAILKADGSMGIGTMIPRSKLDVAGGVKIGNDPSACNTDKSGTIRYGGGSPPWEYCDGTGWVPFESGGGGEGAEISCNEATSIQTKTSTYGTSFSISTFGPSRLLTPANMIFSGFLGGCYAEVSASGDLAPKIGTTNSLTGIPEIFTSNLITYDGTPLFKLTLDRPSTPGSYSVQITSLNQTQSFSFSAYDPGALIFLTQQKFDGDFSDDGPGSPLENADSICQSEASAAGLTGNFKALLADSTTTFAARFPSLQFPIVSVNGTLYDEAAPFNGAYPYYVADFGSAYADGSDASESHQWTGMESNLGSSTDNCNDWTSNASGDNSRVGNAQHGSIFISWVNRSCNNLYNLSCIEHAP